MGTLTNIINTVFTSTGSADVIDDTERLGRAQTRLGNSSTGTSRQFAAQASGLGGLVAAYAGAAATSFALQAAFTGLANSARSLQTLEGLTALAASSATAGNELLATTQKITKGQLSLVESAQQVNLALSAGFNSDQIEGLSEVALKASRALGRDLGDAYTRVVRGSAKMETELLDELGIYTKIEPATRAYAAAIGKTVGQLSEYERRQAFVNSVVAEGQRKFSSINTTIPTSAEKIEAFGKRIVDLGMQLGAFLADRLAPLADFFTNNLAAAIGAFGLLGSLVLGKALSVIRDKVHGFQTWVESSSTQLNKRILNLTKASAQRIQAAQTSVAGINLANKGTTGIKDELKALKEVAAQRALTTQELAKAQTVLQKRIANLDALRLKEIQQVVAARAARAATVAGTAAHIAAQAQITNLGKKLATTNSLLAATTTQLNTVTAATNSSNAAFARFASSVVLRAGTAVAAIARIGVAMIGLGGFVLSAVSIIGILGSSIANALGKGDEFNSWVAGIGKSIKAIFNPQVVKDTKLVFQGLAAGSLANLEKTDQKLRELDSFKFKQKKYLGITIEVEKNKEQLVKEVSSLMSDISLDDGLGIAEIISTGSFWGVTLAGAMTGAAIGAVGALPGAIAGALYGGISAAIGNIILNIGDDAVEATNASINKIRSLYGQDLANIADTAGTASAKTAEKALAVLEDQYGAAARLDPAAKAYLETAKKLVLESAKQVNNVNEIAQIVAATGKSADQVVQNYNFDDSLARLYSTVESKTLGIKLEILNPDDMTTFLSKSMEYQVAIDPTISTADLLTIQHNLAMGISPKEILADFEKQPNLDPKILDFIRELNTLGEEGVNTFLLMGNITRTINIGQIFSEAVTAGNDLNNLLFMTTDLLVSTDQGIKNGTLSFEQYSQAVGNVSAGLDTANRKLPNINAAIQEASNAIALAQSKNLDTSVYENYLFLLQQQKLAAEETIQLEKQKLEVLKDQESVIKTQTDLNSFLSSNTPKTANLFDLELDIYKSASSNKGEGLAITIDYLSQIVTQTNKARTEFEAYQTQVKNSGLSTNIQAALLGATSDNAEEVASALRDIEGVQASIVNGEIQIMDSSINGIAGTAGSIKTITDLVAQSTATAGKLGQDAIASIEANAVEALSTAVSTMQDLMNEYNSLVRDIDQGLIDLANKDRIATIQFQADLSQIYRGIELIKQEAALQQLNLDIELVKAKESAGAMSEVEAAKEENRIRQQVLQEQEYLILLQFGNELMALDARRTLLAEENAQTIAKIQQEGQQLRNKTLADQAYVNALITIYEENITKTQVVNQSLIAGFTTAGNNFNTSLADVFIQATTAIGTAIASMGAIQQDVVAVNYSVPAMEAVENSFATLKTTYGDSVLTTMSAINKQESELLTEQKRRYKEAESLIEAEQLRVVANYESRLAAAAKEGNIEQYNAIARERAAKNTFDDSLKTFNNSLVETMSNITAELSTIASKEIIATLQFEIDQISLEANAVQAAAAFEQKFKENQIRLIQLQVENNKTDPMDGANQINEINAAMLEDQKALIEVQKAAAQEQYMAEVKMQQAEFEATKDNIVAEAKQMQAKIDAEYGVLRSAAEVYASISTELEQALVAGGNSVGTVIVSAINSAIRAFAGSFGKLGTMLGISIQEASFTEQTAKANKAVVFAGGPEGYIEALSEVDVALLAANESYATVSNNITKLANTQVKAAEDAYNRQNELGMMTRAEQIREFDRQVALLAQQEQISKEEAEKRLRDASTAGGGGGGAIDQQLDELDKKIQSLFDSIKGHIESALMSLNNLIFYGEGSFGEIMSNLFKSIQQDIFKQTIADPLSNMLTTKLFGLLGVGVTQTKGEKGLTYEGNSLLVKVVNAADFMAGSVVNGTATDPENSGIVGWMSSLFGKGGTVSNFFSNLFGEGGILANLIGGFGNFLGSIFKAIFGGIFGGGLATGGVVQMAQGGIAGASALRRDRIPALLEPGEFVVRKPVARMVGTPALNALNATGKMPNNGAPIINMTNEGSPKEIQAAQPRFDGEKYVIDIIMRDLSNNGPIRRSLRGGSI